MPDVNSSPSGPRPTLREERAAVTRRRIADAARRLFFRDGYSATTLTGIALEAGVAVQTVYAVYRSKAGILRALRESVVSQPEADASIAAAKAESSGRRRLELFARSIRQRWELAGDVVAINRDASMVDPAVRAEVEETLQIRRRGIAAIARSIETSLPLGVDAARASALIDALTLPEVFAELVEVHGWTSTEYESWLAAALVREVLGPHEAR